MNNGLTNSFIIVFGYLFAAAAAWMVLTSTLEDMTRRDCELGVQTACEALQ